MNKRQRKKLEKQKLEKIIRSNNENLSNKQVKKLLKNYQKTPFLTQSTRSKVLGSLDYYWDNLRNIEQQFKTSVNRFVDFQIELQQENQLKAVKQKFLSNPIKPIDYIARMNELGYRFTEGDLKVIPDLGLAQQIFDRFKSRYTDYISSSRGKGLEHMMRDYFGGEEGISAIITEYYLQNQYDAFDLMSNITDFMMNKVQNSIKEYESAAQTYLDESSRYD